MRVLEITPSKSNSTWGHLLNQLFCVEFWGYLYFFESFWVSDSILRSAVDDGASCGCATRPARPCYPATSFPKIGEHRARLRLAAERGILF